MINTLVDDDFVADSHPLVCQAIARMRTELEGKDNREEAVGGNSRVWIKQEQDWQLLCFILALAHSRVVFLKSARLSFLTRETIQR